MFLSSNWGVTHRLPRFAAGKLVEHAMAACLNAGAGMAGSDVAGRDFRLPLLISLESIGARSDTGDWR